MEVAAGSGKTLIRNRAHENHTFVYDAPRCAGRECAEVFDREAGAADEFDVVMIIH